MICAHSPQGLKGFFGFQSSEADKQSKIATLEAECGALQEKVDTANAALATFEAVALEETESLKSQISDNVTLATTNLISARRVSRSFDFIITLGTGDLLERHCSLASHSRSLCARTPLASKLNNDYKISQNLCSFDRT